MRIVAFAVLALAILIGILIYDTKMKNRQHKMLRALRKLIKGEVTKDSKVTKLDLMAECPMPTTEFNDTITKLKEKDFIITKKNNVSFTLYGLKYYRKKVENVRG